MSKKRLLRMISLAMFVIAVIFVVCALSCPTCTMPGPLEFWKLFYKIYPTVMVIFFVGSFFVK